MTDSFHNVKSLSGGTQKVRGGFMILADDHLNLAILVDELRDLRDSLAAEIRALRRDREQARLDAIELLCIQATAGAHDPAAKVRAFCRYLTKLRIPLDQMCDSLGRFRDFNAPNLTDETLKNMILEAQQKRGTGR